jgi:hypothetical protein
MKKITIVIGLLLIAIVTMAYLYFSKLNNDQHTTDIGLHAATSSSGFIFSYENEKGITDILKEQHLFEEILGQEKYKQLTSLKKYLLALPRINQALDKQNIYIGFVPGNDKEIDFLCCTQISSQEFTHQVLRSLKTSGVKLENLKYLTRLTLADSSVFYLGIKENLVILSNTEQQAAAALTKTSVKKDNKFIDYIQANKRFTKNSLAQLYINFNGLPALLKNLIAGKLTGELAVLNNQDAYAALTYNFSNERVLLTGTTMVNAQNSYYNLFSGMQSQKITINNILPENTASYTIYAIDAYPQWKTKLNNWFLSKKEDKKIARLIADVNAKYHLNLENIFPRYFKNQLSTFQLSTTEKIGAVNLSNGDKMMQLLLDISGDYNENIKVFKEADLLYAYFGQPFAAFKRPFYIIIDNYMVFANNASTLQSFLNSYTNNKLLINTVNYIGASNQLPGNSSISIYIDQQNSADIFNRNIYQPYYHHIRSDKGLKKYDSFTYQLSGDNGKFQTNILINKQPDVLQKDSLAL